jgi:CRP-like cAMP-binding protein
MSEIKLEGCEHCPSKGKGIFCELEELALKNVNDTKSMRTYKKGQTLFLQGEKPTGIYCVQSGKIKLSKTSSEGHETILRIAAAGDVLGHRSLFSHEPFSSTATVIEEATVCFIDEKHMYQAIQEDPKLALALIEKLSIEMGLAERQSASLSHHTVKERFAKLLLRLLKNYGKIRDQRQYLDIKLTREEMASMIGSTNETVTRLMTEFREEGWIELEGKTVFILEAQKLEALIL